MCHTETYHLIHRKKEPKHEWGDITPPFTNNDDITPKITNNDDKDKEESK